MGSEVTNLVEKMFDAFAMTSGTSYVFMCDIKKNYSKWSIKAVEYFGLPGEYMEDAGGIWEERMHPEDRVIHHKLIEEAFSGKRDSVDSEYRVMDREGNYVVCTCKGKVIRDDAGEPAYYAGTIWNHGVIDNIDPATNLYNQYEFFHALELLKGKKQPISIMVLGVKRFSEINEIYGYTLGNKVLRELAKKFMAILRDESWVYRLDGTRYGIICNVRDDRSLQKMYRSLQNMARHEIMLQGEKVTVDLCGGAVVTNNFELDVHDIYAKAKYGLDASKNEKHGELVIVHDDGNISTNNKENIEILNEIRNCVENNCEGFYLCYQPFVSSISEKLLGMEVLLRWKKEPYGNIPPDRFVPWLERDACFFDLGNWILEEAFKEGKKILARYPDFVINVNLSYAQLERSEFRKCLVELLEKTAFPARNLCLELTERCRLLDLTFLRNEIIFLKSYGIKVVLDDFGTGFSSLNLLRELPIDGIKIDRGFVSDITTNNKNQSIVKAVTTCAKELDLNVCVEGIEDEDMKNFMGNFNSSSYQGYYYSRPVGMDEFKKLSFY